MTHSIQQESKGAVGGFTYLGARLQMRMKKKGVTRQVEDTLVAGNKSTQKKTYRNIKRRLQEKQCRGPRGESHFVKQHVSLHRCLSRLQLCSRTQLMQDAPSLKKTKKQKHISVCICCQAWEWQTCSQTGKNEPGKRRGEGGGEVRVQSKRRESQEKISDGCGVVRTEETRR